MGCLQWVIWGAKAAVVEEEMEMGHLCCKAKDKRCREGVLKAKGEEGEMSQMRFLPGLTLLPVCWNFLPPAV